MSKIFDLLRDAQGSSQRAPLGPGEQGDRPVNARMLRGEVLSPVPEVQPTWVRSAEVLRRNWRPAAVFAAVVILTVTLATLVAKPTYEPVAALQIDPPGSEAFSMQAGRSESNSGEYITTQTKKLQSNNLGMEVVQNLHLERLPEFAGREVITSNNPTPEQLTAAQNAALKTLLDSTTVRRDSASRLVYISIGAHEPQLASNVTNTLATLFVEGEERARHEAVARSAQWLRKQLDDIRIRMEESNRTLAEFQRTTGIAPLGENENGNTFSEQMIELNRQLMQARSDRIQLEAYLGRMGGQGLGALPQVSSNPVVQALTQKLAETRADLTNALAVYGTNHPNVKKLQNQADELERQLNAQRAAILNEMKTSYRAAQTREGMVQEQVKDAGKQLTLVAQYLAVKKEADANAQLYNSLSAKIREAGINAESKSNPIRIVDPAPILDAPTRPHRLSQIALGILVGLSGGILLAFIVEGFNTTIRTMADVKKSLGTVPVSVMPVIGTDPSNNRIRGRLLPAGPQSAGRRPLFLLERPRSPEAEALRGLYTSVRLSLDGHAPQVILITSPDQGEGKTTMSVNLAVALAERGKTCVVDADLRKEGVAPAFGISSTHGLGDVLSSSASLKDSLVASSIKNLTVLPAGQYRDDAARLVCSDTMAEVIFSLRSEFEFVLVDSPPILPFADCRALSALVDGVVLVSRSGHTKRESLVRAMELLQNVRSAPVLQIVLNGVENESREYSYYDYGYATEGTGGRAA